MKNYPNSSSSKQNTATYLAQFGKARLIRLENGRYGITGGTPEERQDARDWANSFLPAHTLPGRQN